MGPIRPFANLPSYSQHIESSNSVVPVESSNSTASIVSFSVTVGPVTESEMTMRVLEEGLNQMSMLELRAAEPRRPGVRFWSDLTDSDSGFSDDDDTVSLTLTSESCVREASDGLDEMVIDSLLAQTESLIAQIQSPRFNEDLLVRVQRQIEENKEFLEGFDGVITSEYRNLQFQNSALARIARYENVSTARRITRFRNAGRVL